MLTVASDPQAFKAQAESAVRYPLGAASPLWLAFGAAAAVGAAWFWATRWTRIELAQSQAQAKAQPQPLAVEPAVVVEPAAPVQASADDLTRLVGIGPKLAAALAARGVGRFADIAAWSADDLAAVDRDLNLKGRAVREAWIAQAQRLAAAT